MGDRTGVTDVELALLRAVADRAGRAGAVRTDRVLVDLDRHHVVGPTAAQLIITELIQPWRRHLPLIRGEGNWGSQSGDPPADPEYTEIGLTRVGELAVLAEDRVIGPLPTRTDRGQLVSRRGSAAVRSASGASSAVLSGRVRP